MPGVGHTRYIPWAEEGNGGTFSQVTVLRDWDEELDPGDCWVVSQGSTEQGLGVRGGGLALPLALGLAWAAGGWAVFLTTLEVAGLPGFFVGLRGGVGFGGFGGGGGGGGGQSSPRWCCRRCRYCCSACCCSSPLLLPHPHPNPCTARSCPPPGFARLPPTQPASRLRNPYSTERAILGSFPNIRPNSVSPTRCVRPHPSCHSTGTPRGSAPHVCRLTT